VTGSLTGGFDPLVEFAGVWTTRLAERYLPLPDAVISRYECLDGRLYVAPTEVSSNSWGASRLIIALSRAAEPAGYYVYGSLNLTFGPQRWIQPDVTVLHRVPDSDDTRVWVPADHCTMPVEFVSTSSRRRDAIDKPDLCATAGIRYFMRVEIEPRLRHAAVTLLRLRGKEQDVLAHAIAGQRLAMVEPFPLVLDPAQLLEP
jgi:Uma2 family endonuclease